MKLAFLNKKHEEFITIGLLTFLAGITRLYGLNLWAIDVDESISYLRILAQDFTIIPINDLFVSLFFSLFGSSEFTFRLPSALFGIASIPLMYILIKKFFNRHTAFLAALFTVFSYYHLRHSQFGRYYASIFFFSVLTFYFFIESFRSSNKKFLAGAIICSGIGSIFHPTFFVIPFSNYIFSIFVLTKKRRFSQTTIDTAKIFFWILSISLLLISPFLIKLVLTWHGKPDIWGFRFFELGLQIVKYFGIPITIACFFGLLWMLIKDFTQGLYFTIMIGLPIVLAISASFWINVRPDYIFYIYPLLFMISGYYFDQIREKTANNRYFSITMVIIFISFMLPQFISHYSGMHSLDIRDTAPFFVENYRTGDKILSLHPGFNFYFHKKYDMTLYDKNLDSPILFNILNQHKKEKQRLWIILSMYRTGVPNKLKDWLLNNTKLTWEKPEKRFDFSFKSIRIYLMDEL